MLFNILESITNNQYGFFKHLHRDVSSPNSNYNIEVENMSFEWDFSSFVYINKNKCKKLYASNCCHHLSNLTASTHYIGPC